MTKKKYKPASAVLLLALLALCLWPFPASAQTGQSRDTVEGGGGFFKRVIRYFDESNKPKEYKRFDFSILGGPHYSSDTKLGLGLVAAGKYRTSRADTFAIPSHVSLYGDITTSGFYLLGLRGIHIFPADKWRIDYNLFFYSFPTKYWGIGYVNASDDGNESEYDDFRVKLRADFLFRLARGMYAGPGMSFDWTRARNVEDAPIWDGVPLTTRNFGIGVQLRWDTRDNLTAPREGWLVGVEQKFFPKGMVNDDGFCYTDFQLNHYRPVWKGGIIAGRYHLRYSYGDVPWGMMPSFGGSSTMRGYYEGRYRDKGEMDITVELRQHVWRRNGFALWLGAGTVFPEWSGIRTGHILPNAGIGYRWEFKKNTNVRLDFGIGKGETGFIFNIDEAF